MGAIPMTAAAGYSGTPLPQKLGLKDGQRALFIALPPELSELRTSRHFREMAQAGWETWTGGDRGWDFVQGFTTSRAVLEANARPLMQAVDRTDPDEVERAHACYEALFAAGQAMGCVPYRLGVQSMALLNEQHAVPELLQRLKQAVDPQNIIAPGRYGLG